MGKMRTHEEVAAVIAARTRREGDCLIWQGRSCEKGYGLMEWGNEGRAHRIAYIIAHGPIPPGMFVCHRCDTPACVEPTHLVAGTPVDNMRDARERSRRVGRPISVVQHPVESAPTRKQIDLLMFMVAWERVDGLLPTRHQMLLAPGVRSLGAVGGRINQLERRGLIDRSGCLRITARGYAEVAARTEQAA